MAQQLKITRTRIGSIHNIESAANAARDLESLCNDIINLLATIESNPVAGELKFLAREEDGSYHLYSFVMGAGMSMVVDTAAKTCTLTSP